MKLLLQAFLSLTFLTFITGILYPLTITVVALVFFPARSQGSLVYDKGHAVGSRLIGQNFTDRKYFWPRPSATNYSPMPSGGSNLNPISASLRTLVDSRRAAFRSAHGLLAKDTVPNDMLFASGSGLDPDISPDAARLQIGRVARERHLTESQKSDLSALVERSIVLPQLGFLGNARVNVLRLNQNLDRLCGFSAKY